MSATMKDKDVVSKGPKRRDPVCFQTLHAILIPAGTILRQESGKDGAFTCPLSGGVFSVLGTDASQAPDTYKRVVA